MNPKKCQIWTRRFAGCMFIIEKNSWTKDNGNLDPLQSWWFPPRNHETSSVMIRFMKGVHDDINQTFSAFYQGTVRPYHGTMPGVIFFKHLFRFFYSWKPSKRRIYGWLLPHISLKYLPIPCKRHENVLNSTSMVFQTVLVHLFMHRLFKFELCALMPRKCT